MGYTVTDMTMTKNMVIVNGVSLLVAYAVSILTYRLTTCHRLLPWDVCRLTLKIKHLLYRDF